MADKIKKGKIYVEADYDNIILIDPNKVIVGDEIRDRVVDQEDLVFYANLETSVIPRTKLAVGEGFGSPVSNTLIASIKGDNSQPFDKINFLQPKGKKGTNADGTSVRFFDDSWADQISGKGSRQGLGANQTIQSYQGEKGKVTRLRNVTNYEDTQMFGMTNISIDIQPNSGPGGFVPTVTIDLIDINGRTLFEQGENSIYGVFFNQPYPIFYLTIKGYYGKAIRYTLYMIDFSCSFEQGTGDFKVQIKLTSNMISLLEDTTLHNAKTAPKMFPIEVSEAKTTNNSGGNIGLNNKVNLTTKQISLGRQKLEEIYQIYEEKGLITKNFPRLTIEQLILNIDNYDIDVTKSIQQGDFVVINDLESFKENLNELVTNNYDEVKSTFLDLNNFIVYKKQIYYPFQSSIGFQVRLDLLDAIKKETAAAVDNLKRNKSFGKNGEYNLGQLFTGQEIPVKFKEDETFSEFDTDLLEKDDFRQTYILRYQKEPSDLELEAFTNNLKVQLQVVGQKFDPNTKQLVPSKPILFKYGEKTVGGNEFVEDSFLYKVKKIESQLDVKKQEIEERLTRILADKLQDKDKGLGFEPTIRNIFAVIMAGCDTFYSLMDYTHREAWARRNNPDRIKSIIPPDKNYGIDSKNVLNKSGNLNDQNVVYPWPTYVVERQDSTGKNAFLLEYIGDPKNESKTKALDYNVWPEVYFTENYLDATVTKGTLASQTNYSNPSDISNFSSCNAIEFPFKNRPYSITQDISFYYELFERTLLLSHYSGFFIPNGLDIKTQQVDKFLTDLETNNIKNAISNNYILQETLRNYKFNYTQFSELLKTFIQSYASVSRGNFVTPYISGYLSDSFSLYNLNTIGSNSITLTNDSPLSDNFKKFLKQPNFTKKLYPWDKFSNPSEDVFVYLDDKKIVARLDETETTKNINLFTTNYTEIFANSDREVLKDYQNTTINDRVTLKNFYNESLSKNRRITNMDFFTGTDPSDLSVLNSQSLLNTPFFINALMKGVELERNGNVQNPYVALGFIYLNSLPFEKIINEFNYFENNKNLKMKTNIGNSFKKFTAIHRLPYAWILKYGSAWHRYKRYVEDNEDILKDVLINFDYKKAYDPDTQNLERVYKIKNYTGGTIDFKAYKREVSATNSSKVIDVVSTGFYPKVVNDLHYYLKGYDLFNQYNEDEFTDVYNKGILKIGLNTNAQRYVQFGEVPSDPNRSITLSPFFSYFTFVNDVNINAQETVYIPIPSNGGININEGYLRSFNGSNKFVSEITGNTSIYNGSVRSMWGLSNFGYFNFEGLLANAGTEILDPNYIWETNNLRVAETPIYRLLAIFKKEELDLFEKLFLGFCNPNAGPNEIFPLEGDKKDPTYASPSPSPSVKNRRLKDQILSLLSIKASQATVTRTNENADGMSLANANSKNIFTPINEFIKDDVILKIGNPDSFDLKLYSAFASDPLYKITDPPVFRNYIPGTLPGDGTNVTLLASQSNPNNIEAWKAMKLYVGNFDEVGLKYSDSGSSYTKFFIELNIEFTKENIKACSELIKWYATIDNSLIKGGISNGWLKSGFIDYINGELKSYKDGQIDVLNGIFSKLNNDLPALNLEKKNNRAKVSGNVNKLETYNMFQTFNNRWIAGSDLTNRTLFEDFLFLNTANVDIGDRLTLNVKMVQKYLKQENLSINSLISAILEDDATSVLYAVPAYVNFYNILDSTSATQPINYDAAGSVFDTFNEVNYLDSRQKFIIQYIGKKSEIVDGKNNENYVYQNDAYDLGDPANCAVRVPDNQKIDPKKGNRVVAFNVDYAMRNQNLFKDISIDTNNGQITSATIKFNENLANQANADSVAQQTQSMYSFYKSQSFSCSVDMLGCAMIQPTMYFNLRHVPLFYGPYLIQKVSHKISQTDFSTNFEGVRQPKYSLPDPDRNISFVRKNYLESVKDQILSTIQPGRFIETSATTFLDEGQTFPEIRLTSEEACAEKVRPQYRTLSFISATTGSQTFSALTQYIGTKGVETIRNIYIMGTIMLQPFNSVDDVDETRTPPTITTNPIITFPNENPINFAPNNDLPPDWDSYYQGLICLGNNLQSQPLFAFSNFKDCLDLAVGFYESVTPLLTGVYNLLPGTDDREKNISALTYTYLTSLNGNLEGKTSSDIKDFIETNLSSGTISQSKYDSVDYYMAYCYDKYYAPCFKPTELTLTSVSAFTATVTWKEPNYYGALIAPSNGYDYYLSTTDLSPLPNTTTPTQSGLSDKEKVLDPLSSGTTYYFYVRSDCGGGKKSLWNGPLPFTTF